MDNPENTKNFRTFYLFAITGALIVLLAYFTPWVGVDSQSASEKQATFKRSLYELKALSDTEIPAEVVDNVIKKYVIDSVNDAYGIKSKHVTENYFGESFNRETVNSLMPSINNLEESTARLIDKVLTDKIVEEKLLKSAVEAEKKSIDDTAKDLEKFFDILAKIDINKLKMPDFTDADLAKLIAEQLDAAAEKDKPANHAANCENALNTSNALLDIVDMTNLPDILAGKSTMSEALIDKLTYLYTEQNADKLTSAELSAKKILLKTFNNDAPVPETFSSVNGARAEVEHLKKQMDALFGLGEKAIFENRTTKFDALKALPGLLIEPGRTELQTALDKVKTAVDALETVCVPAVRKNKISADDARLFLSEAIKPSISNPDTKDAVSDELAAQFVDVLKSTPEDTTYANYIETIHEKLGAKGKELLKEVNDPALLCKTVFPAFSMFVAVNEYASRDEIAGYMSGLAADEKQIAENLLDTILLLNEKTVANAGSFRLTLNNDIYITELLKDKATEKIASEINTFLNGYMIINKLEAKQFTENRLQEFARNMCIDKFVAGNFSGEPAKYFNTTLLAPVTGLENISGGKISPMARKAIAWQLASELLSSADNELMGYFNEPYYSIYSLIKQNAQADNLQKNTILKNNFRNQLSEMLAGIFADNITGAMKEDLGKQENLPKALTDIVPALCLTDNSGICGRLQVLYEKSGIAVSMINDMTNKESGNVSEKISYMFTNHFFDVENLKEDGSDIIASTAKAFGDTAFFAFVKTKLDSIDRDNVITAGYNKLFKSYADLCTSAIASEIILKNPGMDSRFLNSLVDSRKKSIAENDSAKLEKLTMSNIRSFQRALNYIRDKELLMKPVEDLNGSEQLCRIMSTMGDPQGRASAERKLGGLLTGQISAKYALKNDALGINSAMDIMKITYGNTHIIKQAVSTSRNSASAYEWSTLLLVGAILILVLGIIGMVMNSNTVILSLIGSAAFVLLFWFAIRISYLPSKVLVATGAGALWTGIGLFITGTGSMLSMKLSNKQLTVLIGAILVILGFFLPWVGKDPDTTLAWKSGLTFLLQNMKLDVWNMCSCVFVVFPILALLCLAVSLFVKNTGLILFLISILSISFFTGLVFGISQTTQFWAGGIVVTATGFSTIMIGNAIKS